MRKAQVKWEGLKMINIKCWFDIPLGSAFEINLSNYYLCWLVLIRLTWHFDPITAVLTVRMEQLSYWQLEKQAAKLPFYRWQFAYLYNIKSIMNEAPPTKLINLKELTLLLDWLRASPDRKTIVASAAKKYASVLKNLSPEEVFTKAQNRNIKINSKEANGEETGVGNMERWDFNEYSIFVWISAYISLKENVELKQMTHPHFQAIHRIFRNKSLAFIRYNLRNLVYMLHKKNEDWMEEEIALLETVMKEFNDTPDWKLASFTLFCRSNGRFFRTVPQCRQKWLNYLNPKVKKDKWTQEEDNLLFMLVGQMGCQWSKISKSFKQTRNEHSVKNRYNCYKKQWKKGVQSGKHIKISPIIKKVLKDNDIDIGQEAADQTSKMKYSFTSKNIFQQSSNSNYEPQISSDHHEKVHKRSVCESDTTSLHQKSKQSVQVHKMGNQPSIKKSKKSQKKIENDDGACVQFDLSSYFHWSNKQFKIEKQLEQMPKLMTCQQMNTGYEIQADMVRILGCSHYEAILSHQDWIGRIQEEKNMEWIDI